MNVDIYFKDLCKSKILYTANVKVKEAIILRLQEQKAPFICNIDESLRYTIQLIL
jgi:hypothetical protein